LALSRGGSGELCTNPIEIEIEMEPLQEMLTMLDNIEEALPQGHSPEPVLCGLDPIATVCCASAVPTHALDGFTTSAASNESEEKIEPHQTPHMSTMCEDPLQPVSTVIVTAACNVGANETASSVPEGVTGEQAPPSSGTSTSYSVAITPSNVSSTLKSDVAINGTAHLSPDTSSLGAAAPQLNESGGGASQSAEPDTIPPVKMPETLLQAVHRLWRIKKFRCLVLALGPTALGYLSPYTHLKAYAISPVLQFSASDASIALSAIGAASVMGRIGMGKVGDMHIAQMPPHIVRNWLFLLSAFGAAISVGCLGAVTSFGGLVVAAVGFGLFSGAILSVMPVIAADAVGVKDLPIALPIMYFVQVPGFVLGAPIAGWVKVAANSYRPAFALSGALMLLGAFALIPLAWDLSPRADSAGDAPAAHKPDILTGVQPNLPI
jgi:hypothetical protein